jgi:prepilin-type N-terminal cleavage/methylation domain-containing protein
MNPVARSEGFTLTELVWVIVVVGILMTVAIIRYLDMSRATKRAACFQNQAVLEEAQTLFYTEAFIRVGHGDYASALDDLLPFIQSGEIPLCPDHFDYILLDAGAVDCESPHHHRR